MRRLLVALGLVATGLLASARPARAVIVERIVAVVGERPILLSELRHRAKPDLLVLYVTTQDPGRAAVEETKVYRRVLDHMIDELLVEQAAQKGHLAVSVDEIDKAIERKAGELHVSAKDLVAEAMREGLTEQDYRDEIRRQILEGKLVQLRVAGRVRVTESDARAAYQRWAKEMEAQQYVELDVLAMLLPPGATDAQIAAKDALAQEIVMKTRAGADFCALVKEFSDHTPSRDTCGKRVMPMKMLPPAVQEQLAALREGELAPPIRFGSGELDVIRLGKRAKVQPYEEVRDQMMNLAGEEVFQKQRELYLKELRRGVYLDVRLNA